MFIETPIGKNKTAKEFFQTPIQKNKTAFRCSAIVILFSDCEKIYRYMLADKRIIRIFAQSKMSFAMDTFCFTIHHIGTNRFIS